MTSVKAIPLIAAATGSTIVPAKDTLVLPAETFPAGVQGLFVHSAFKLGIIEFSLNAVPPEMPLTDFMRVGQQFRQAVERRG